MCGICGIFHTDSQQRVERGALAKMNQQIAHRGPDDDGFFVEGNIGLAMRRLQGAELTQENLRQRTLTVRYDPATASIEQIRQSLNTAGYQSTIVS